MRRFASLLLALSLVSPALLHAQDEDAKAIIERAVKAAGGADALLSRSLHSRIKGKTFSAKRESHATFEGENIECPDGRERMTLSMDLDGTNFKIVSVAAGDKSWTTINGELTDVLNDPETDAQRRHVSRVLRLVPLLREKDFTITALGPSKVQGKDAVGVKVSCKGHPDVSIFFDKTSNLMLEHAARIKQTTTKKEALEETYYGDFRAVNDGVAEEQILKEAKLATDGPALVKYLREQIPDTGRQARLKALVKQLGDDSFKEREKATEELLKIGKPAVALLRDAINDPDLEIRRRAKDCLSQLEKTGDRVARVVPAIQLLAIRHPPGAVEVLLDLLPSADAETARLIKGALVALAERDGKPDPALMCALEDKDQNRRAAAEAVLGKDGGKFLKEPDRRLYMRGILLPRSVTSFTDGEKDTILEIVEVEYRNRIDDKVFSKK